MCRNQARAHCLASPETCISTCSKLLQLKLHQFMDGLGNQYGTPTNIARKHE